MIALEMPSVKKIETLARSIQDCISLAQGALRIGGVDQHTKEYVRQILLTDKADYYQDPLGIAPLRQRLALTLSERFGTKINHQQIFISHGSMGALSALLQTILEAGDEVLLPEPTYPAYVGLVKVAKGVPKFATGYSLTKNKNGSHKWEFDLEKIKHAITTKTKMIILSNPSNPTGVCLTPQDLQELAWICEDRGIYLVCDEVYDDFVFEGTFESSTPYAAHSNFIIRVGSFSKNFGMSGWRVGYAVAQENLVETIGAVQAVSISCPTVIGQYAALYALEHREYTDHYAAIVKKNRDVVCDFLKHLEQSKALTFGPPAAGFYVFFKINEPDSNEFVLELINRAKVALTPGSDFGPTARQCVRLCFAREPELLQQAIARLKAYFSAKHLNLLDDSPLAITV